MKLNRENLSDQWVHLGQPWSQVPEMLGVALVPQI